MFTQNHYTCSEYPSLTKKLVSIQRNINPNLKHNAREEKIFTSVDNKFFVNLPNFTLVIVITITNSFVSVDLKFDEFLRELFKIFTT